MRWAKALRAAFSAFWKALKSDPQPLVLRGDNIAISNCTLSGGVVVEGDYLTISNCVFEEGGAGIVIESRQEKVWTIEEDEG